MDRADETRNKRLLVCVVPLAVLGMGSHASAQAAAPSAAIERSTSFQAVQGAVKEDVPGGPLLVGAYALIWLGVLAYVVRLVRLQRRAESDLARLEQLLTRVP